MEYSEITSEISSKAKNTRTASEPETSDISIQTETTLDVGSGKHPLVNAFHADVDKASPHLECVCDVQNLPFVNNCFKAVHISHVLEHVDDPTQAIKELNRVSSDLLVLKTPNAYHLKSSEDPTHLFSWNPNTLKQLLNKHLKKVEINTWTSYGGNKLLTLKNLVLASISNPCELVANCRVNK